MEKQNDFTPYIIALGAAIVGGVVVGGAVYGLSKVTKSGFLLDVVAAALTIFITMGAVVYIASSGEEQKKEEKKEE